MRAETAASQQMAFEKGIGFGKLAQQIFPDGKDALPIDHFHYLEAINQTYNWIQSVERAIYKTSGPGRKLYWKMN